MIIAFSDRALIANRQRSPGCSQSLSQTGGVFNPSLRAKNYDETRDWWQARVNQNWRFYFTIEGETYRIQDITPHPK